MKKSRECTHQLVIMSQYYGTRNGNGTNPTQMVAYACWRGSQCAAICLPEGMPYCASISLCSCHLCWWCFSSDLPLQAWHTDRTQTAEATVVVCVSDVNEPPRWPRSLYITSVSERPQVDTEIYHLIAVDDDSGSLVSQLHITICLKLSNMPTHQRVPTPLTLILTAVNTCIFVTLHSQFYQYSTAKSLAGIILTCSGPVQ